jgi:hypothetical protein
MPMYEAGQYSFFLVVGSCKVYLTKSEKPL